MDHWAFATSPHGLGLAPEVFWSLRTNEFLALRRAWAQEQAKFYNAHFSGNGPAWMPDDFLKPKNRERRIAQGKRDKIESDMLNFKLAQIEASKGKGPGKNIPFWAREDWDGSIPMKEAHAG